MNNRCKRGISEFFAVCLLLVSGCGPDLPAQWKGKVPVEGLNHVGDCQPAQTSFCADYARAAPIKTFLAGYNAFVTTKGGFSSVCFRPSKSELADIYVLRREQQAYQLQAFDDSEAYSVSIEAIDQEAFERLAHKDYCLPVK
jgi:hypothetical protein